MFLAKSLLQQKLSIIHANKNGRETPCTLNHCGVMVIVVGIGHGDTSSNPKRD